MQNETTETQTLTPTRRASNPQEITNLKKSSARSISVSLTRLDRSFSMHRVLELIAKNNKVLYINNSLTAYLFFDKKENDLAQEIYNAFREVTFLVLRDWVDE